MLEKVRRHEYIARGPRERYARTVTAVQEHGWQDQLEINKQVDTIVQGLRNVSLRAFSDDEAWDELADNVVESCYSDMSRLDHC